MARYRKKPVEIDAFKWTGGPDQVEDPKWICDAIRAGSVHVLGDPCQLRIATLEGDMKASPGDYIIRGVQGEIYPCKPDIFEATYQRVEE